MNFQKNISIVIFFILLYLFIPSTTLAQYRQGLDYIVLTSQDTLYGTVEYINSEAISPDFYKKIRLIDPDGKRRRFKRKHIQAFRAYGESYERFYLDQSSRSPGKVVLVNPRYDINPISGTPYFLRLIKKGKLSHYLLEWWDQGDATPMTMDLLKKEDDSFFIRATQGIFGIKKKVLTDYFSNCPQLAELIEKKQVEDVSGIVDFYNSTCD